MVKIKQQLVSSRAKTSSGTNGRKYITIHETANTSKGADAQVHANLQSRGFTASWHWQVDDVEAIQSYPHTVRCWHSGDGTGDGNSNSIGIEICVNSDGDFKKTVQNAVELVQHIMKEENIPVENVVQHNRWSGKNCPTNLRNGSKGIDWDDFIAMVKDEEVEQVSKPVEKEAPKSSTSKTESIVDYLNARDMDASFSARAKLATQYGISGYKGEAEQNVLLLERIRSGWKPAAKAKPSTVKTNSVVDYLNQQGKDSSFGARAKLAEQYGIRNYSGDADQNLQLLEKLQGGAPKQTKEYVHLPKSVTAWKTYKLNVQPVSENSDWSLTPSRFGGLDYEVLGKPFANVVTIKTSRGNRNIYVAPSTGARFIRK